MLLSLMLAALRGHRCSIATTVAIITVWSAMAVTPAWLPAVAWCTASILLLAIWYAAEPLLHRLHGARRPSAREAARLAAALSAGGDAEPASLLIRDDATIQATAGIRTVVVSSGCLEALDDRQLAAVVVHELAHVRSGDAVGRALVWVGNLPLLGLGVATGIVARCGQLLAALIGAGLVVPALLCPAGFVKWVGRVLTVPLVAIIALYCLALGDARHSGALGAVGVGMLVAWALVPALRTLVAWESRARETAADRATIAAGLGGSLLEALELIQSLESPGHQDPSATLLSTHPPTELRIDALQQLLS